MTTMAMTQPGQITLYSNFVRHEYLFWTNACSSRRVVLPFRSQGAHRTRGGRGAIYDLRHQLPEHAVLVRGYQPCEEGRLFECCFPCVPHLPSPHLCLTGHPQVPAITYGGPPSPPEAPHPEAARIAESLVIVEFLAELFPSSGLHPSDLVQRARARHTITVFETQVFDAYIKFVFGQQPGAPLLDALAAFQARLPEAGGFAVGEWSIADVAAAPFMIRMPLSFEHDLGQYPEGEGKKVMEELRTPRFARLMRYIEDLKNHPSVRKTYDEVRLSMWDVRWMDVADTGCRREL